MVSIGQFVFCFVTLIKSNVQFLHLISVVNRDGSVIYGNNMEGMQRVRTFKDGKLKISGDGLLEHDENGIPISGDVRNCWAGFSLLQALFAKEHNAACDMLKVS